MPGALARSVAPTLALALALARPAHADKWDELGLALGLIETLIPDLRVERSVTADDTRLIYAFPIALHHGGVPIGRRYGLSFTSFGEVQLHGGDEAVRGLLGERAYLHPRRDGTVLIPLVELGGLVSGDDAGGMLGLGLAFALPHTWPRIGLSPTLGLVVRAVKTDRETRGDVAIDVQIPIALDE